MKVDPVRIATKKGPRVVGSRRYLLQAVALATTKTTAWSATPLAVLFPRAFAFTRHSPLLNGAQHHTFRGAFPASIRLHPPLALVTRHWSLATGLSRERLPSYAAHNPMTIDNTLPLRNLFPEYIWSKQVATNSGRRREKSAIR